MAIKVIKHGETKFKLTCPVCGCEFEYDYEDLVECYISGFKQIKCPDCGEWLTHKKAELVKDITWNFPKPGESIPCDKKNKWFYVDYPNPNVTWTSNIPDWPDCETCPNKPDPTKTIVGDTPCTWCKKNTPYCSTIGDSKLDYTSSISNEASNTTTYTDLNLGDVPEIKSDYTTDIK